MLEKQQIHEGDGLGWGKKKQLIRRLNYYFVMVHITASKGCIGMAVAVAICLVFVHLKKFSIVSVSMFSRSIEKYETFQSILYVDGATEQLFLPLGAQDSVLPNWIQEYMVFHERETKRFEERSLSGEDLSAPDVKFLVMNCVDKHCRGGVVDRLTLVPFFVLMAVLSERVLLIKWSTPSQLENFLVPPMGGID